MNFKEYILGQFKVAKTEYTPDEIRNQIKFTSSRGIEFFPIKENKSFSMDIDILNISILIDNEGTAIAVPKYIIQEFEIELKEFISFAIANSFIQEK